jgi:hypothetical protein
MGRIKLPSGLIFRAEQQRIAPTRRKQERDPLRDIAAVLQLGEQIYTSPIVRDIGMGVADWLTDEDEPSAPKPTVTEAAKAKVQLAPGQYPKGEVPQPKGVSEDPDYEEWVAQQPVGPWKLGQPGKVTSEMVYQPEVATIQEPEGFQPMQGDLMFAITGRGKASVSAPPSSLQDKWEHLNNPAVLELVNTEIPPERLLSSEENVEYMSERQVLINKVGNTKEEYKEINKAFDDQMLAIASSINKNPEQLGTAGWRTYERFKANPEAQPRNIIENVIDMAANMERHRTADPGEFLGVTPTGFQLTRPPSLVRGGAVAHPMIPEMATALPYQIPPEAGAPEKGMVYNQETRQWEKPLQITEEVIAEQQIQADPTAPDIPGLRPPTRRVPTPTGPELEETARDIARFTGDEYAQIQEAGPAIMDLLNLVEGTPENKRLMIQTLQETFNIPAAAPTRIAGPPPPAAPELKRGANYNEAVRAYFQAGRTGQEVPAISADDIKGVYGWAARGRGRQGVMSEAQANKDFMSAYMQGAKMHMTAKGKEMSKLQETHLMAKILKDIAGTKGTEARTEATKFKTARARIFAPEELRQLYSERWDRDLKAWLKAIDQLKNEKRTLKKGGIGSKDLQKYIDRTNKRVEQRSKAYAYMLNNYKKLNQKAEQLINATAQGQPMPEMGSDEFIQLFGANVNAGRRAYRDAQTDDNKKEAFKAALRKANKRRVQESKKILEDYKKVDALFQKIHKQAQGLGDAKTREDRLKIVDNVVEGLESLIPLGAK